MLVGNCRVVAGIVVLTLFTSGCESAEDYQRLSAAGTNYVEMLDSLLVLRGNLRIDRTSRELLTQDRITEGGITSDDYDRRVERDRQLLVQLNDIRQHNQLLADYFIALNQLATSDAPETVQTSINEIFANLTTVSAPLQSFTQGFSDILLRRVSELPRLAVDARIRGALRSELEQRQELIRRELILQQELLEILASQIEDDSRNLASREEQISIINPLVNGEPVSDEEAWIISRREILVQTIELPQELRNAQAAAVDFQEIFEGFVSGEIDSSRLELFLTNIEELITEIESSGS